MLSHRKFTIKQLLCLILTGVWCGHVVGAEFPREYSNIPGVDCVINPYRVADVASPVAGIIERLNVQRSQQVSAGQVVAQLNADVERANVDLAKFRAGIQSEINLGSLNMDFDARRAQRFNTLRQQKIISAENLEEAEREEGLSKWKLQQARELANVRKLELHRAEEQLSQKSIRAPFDGFILDTFKHSGEYVEDQAILRMAQLDPLVIEAIVPMENFGQITAGMQAEILPEILSTDHLLAKVTIVDRIGDTASRTFGVRLVMPNPDNRIPAGLKCVVKFLQPTDALIEAAEQERTAELHQASLLVEGVIDRSDTQAPVEAIEIADSSVAEENNDVVERVEDELIVDDDIDEEITDEITQQQPELPARYMVFMRQGKTREAVRERIKQLQTAGVVDLQEIDSGRYAGLIALGVYSRKQAAERRIQALETQGFTAFVMSEGEIDKINTQVPVETIGIADSNMPDKSNDVVERVEDDIDDEIAEEITQQQPGLSVRYMVFMQQGPTHEAILARMNDLQTVGVVDLQKIDSGRYAGLIALGVYSSKQAAESRIQSLEAQGFTAFINELN